MNTGSKCHLWSIKSSFYVLFHFSFLLPAQLGYVLDAYIFKISPASLGFRFSTHPEVDLIMSLITQAKGSYHVCFFFIEAYPVQPRQLPSAGCGWHCIWLPVARRCSSRCPVPGCNKAGEESPAAFPRPDTPLPSCLRHHTLGRTSYDKCRKTHSPQAAQPYVFCLSGAAREEMNMKAYEWIWKHLKFGHIEQEHIPQLLVLFSLWPDMDYNRVNPMS